MLLSITLTYHVVAIYVYPIAIASLYFSKTLNVVATGLTVAGGSVGQILAFSLDTLQDDNFTEFKGVIIFGVIPRALVLIAVAAIFTMLCSRTASMLSNLMGAEEQKEMFDRMKQMKDNAAETSKIMFGMVEELSRITETSLKANQNKADETQCLLLGSTENTMAVENADSKIQDITEQLIALSDMNHRTAKLTDQIGENTQENQKRMDDATVSMEQIHNSTNECKKIISNLGEESKEIIGIVETITQISSKTNILALNAAIEAARAGEVADNMKQISNNTQQNCDAAQHVFAETQENSAGTESLAKIVEQIKELSEQLNKVVQG